MQPKMFKTVQTVPASEPKSRGSIACLLFVVALGGAFWAGALWAGQPWMH